MNLRFAKKETILYSPLHIGLCQSWAGSIQTNSSQTPRTTKSWALHPHNINLFTLGKTSFHSEWNRGRSPRVQSWGAQPRHAPALECRLKTLAPLWIASPGWVHENLPVQHHQPMGKPTTLTSQQLLPLEQSIQHQTISQTTSSSQSLLLLIITHY